MRTAINAALLALLALGGAAIYAALYFANNAKWVVNATLSPASKVFNSSLYPLANAWFQYAGAYNVTYYYMKFMPGWPELYTVGAFAARGASWQGKLEAIGRSGSGVYAIALGNAVQITQSQDAGPYTPLTAPLNWYTVATSRYSVLACAWFNQSGVYVQQLVNFTAEPMRELAQWTFYCGNSTYIEDFSASCKGWGFDTPVSWVKFYTSGKNSVARYDNTTGNPPPSVYLQGQNGWGAVFINVSQWMGPQLASSTYSIEIFMQAAITGSDYIQLNFFIDLNGDGKPDLEVIYYYSVNGRNPVALSSVIYGYALQNRTVLLGTSFPTKTWTPVSLTTYSSGYVVGLAVVIYSPYGNTRGWVDNFRACALPPNVKPYTHGAPNSSVYISLTLSPASPPSLATEVDAYGNTGNVSSDYGYAVAQYWLPQEIPAAGTSISVLGLYIRNSTDAQNNAAFVSVAVDLNGDGKPDREYIYYRTDGAPFAIVSSFISPGSLVCVNTCTNTTQYYFKYLGPMSSGNTYSWNIQLGDIPGAIVGVAFGVVDAAYNGPGTLDDFWVFWDNLSITYSACPPPSGWIAGGNVWVSNNYLLVSGGYAVVPLVSGALTYVANFTGVGTYAVFTSALTPSFGVYWRGSTSGCIFGASPPGSRYVELRPLQGLGDVIIRNAYGNILARFGCQSPAAPAYVGFRAGPGEILKIYLLEAWG